MDNEEKEIKISDAEYIPPADSKHVVPHAKRGNSRAKDYSGILFAGFLGLGAGLMLGLTGSARNPLADFLQDNEGDL